MRTLHPWVFVAALVACSGGETKTDTDTPNVDGDADADADADADTDADADVDCFATIVSVDPEDGERLIPVDQVVTVGFSEAISANASWSLEVVPATGTATLAPDGLSASWSGTLDPDATYTINASVCDDAKSATFYTIAPAVDPALVNGNTYAVAWDDMVINEPGNGAAVSLLVQIDYVIAQVLAIDEVTDTADALATVGLDDGYGNAVPDCTLAVQQTADFSLNPYFSIDGSIEIVVNGNGDTVQVEDFVFLARVSEDGASLTNVQISGLIATEDVLTDQDCYSAGVQLLQPTCLPCTSSLTGYCMLLEAEATLATEIPLDLAATCAI